MEDGEFFSLFQADDLTLILYLKKWSQAEYWLPDNFCWNIWTMDQHKELYKTLELLNHMFLEVFMDQDMRLYLEILNKTPLI